MIRNLERNKQLVQIIEKNPGIQFREIMRLTGMKNGVLSHHLSKLESNSTVKVQRGSRQTRFFPLNLSEQESKIAKALRRETPRDIITALILNEKLEFSEIVQEVKKSPSTVSLYLSQIVEDGIVVLAYENRRKVYRIKEKFVVDKLIEDYHPGLIDRPTSGFEDMINSL